MDLPEAGHSHLQERGGVLAVAQYAVNRGSLFRETPLADVGIDAQLELLTTEGFATGRLVALQITPYRRKESSSPAASAKVNPAGNGVKVGSPYVAT